MVSLSFPAINCASAPDISPDDFDSLSSPSSSVSSFELASVSDSVELEDWSIMSLNDQLQSLSDLRLDDVKLINKHPNYYIAGGDVVFLVGKKLFRVHRHFFVRESAKFKDLLSAQSLTRTGAEPVGHSDSRPIPMNDVTIEEFESFLWIFYNEHYHYKATVERWSAILRLSHIWKFPKIKDLAVRELDNLQVPVVDKALMARNFEIDPCYGWLAKAYAALGAREAPISKLEGEKLGLDTVLHLAELREKIRKRRFEEKTSTTDGESVAHSEHDYAPVQNGGDKYSNGSGPAFTYAQAPQNGWVSSGWGGYHRAQSPLQVPMQYAKPSYPSYVDYIQPPQPITPPRVPEGAYYPVRNVRDYDAQSTVTEYVVENSSFSDEDVADARSVFGL